jgi:cell wall-associated NlpC family hydrolase
MVTVDAMTSLQQLRATFASLTGGSSANTGGTASSTNFDSLIATITAGSSAGTSGSDPSDLAFSASALLGSSAASSSTGSLASNGAVTGADVVADAEKYIGVPYVLGGESTSGIDCSGLVQKTFADLGVSVTRLVHTQKLEGQAVDGLANAKPGDLIVFKGGGHIGIYAGNGMVIHAPYPGRTVSLQKLWVGDAGIETSTEPTLAQAKAALVSAQQAVMQADLAMMSNSDDSSSSSTSSNSLSSLSSLSTLTDPTASASGTTSTDSTVASSGTDTISQYIAAQEALITQGAS